MIVPESDSVMKLSERELLVGASTLIGLKNDIDPLIDMVHTKRGYLEERRTEKIIPLDSSTTITSIPYEKTFRHVGFDALKLTSVYNHCQDEDQLIYADLILRSVGSLNSTSYIFRGGKHYVEQNDSGDTQQSSPQEIADIEARQILQDIRSMTKLGYSSTDRFDPAQTVLNDLESIGSDTTISKIAKFQSARLDDLGATYISLGKSVDHPSSKGHGATPPPARTIRSYEIGTTLPIEEGSYCISAIYKSIVNNSRNRLPSLRLSASIDSSSMTEEKKKAILLNVLNSYQDKDPTRLGQSIIKHLKSLNDPDTSEFIRTSW